MSKDYFKNKYQSGLTVMELLVVISIFTIITGITIFNYNKFNSSSSIQNLADDIALTVRKAQGYAIGVRGFSDPNINGYGIHFTSNPDPSNVYYTSGSNSSFILFADMKDGDYSNKKYDYQNEDYSCGNNQDIVSPIEGKECIEILNIMSSDEISDIYINDNQDPINEKSSVDLIFKRPNPEPFFCYREIISSDCDSINISSITIKISSLKNEGNNGDILKFITISNNGQISVANSRQ